MKRSLHNAFRLLPQICHALMRLVVFAGSLWVLAVPWRGEGAEPKPNFIVILIDDLGWADVGCHGSTFHKTPQIDRLAAEGMRFTDAYAAGPVCSPTRASLLTGKDPARLHLTDWLPGRQDRPSQRLLKPEIHRHLPLTEVTLAEALRPAGYVSASIGKWHLGGRGFAPQDQGFDLNVAGDDTGTPLSYFAPFRSGPRVMPGLETSRAGEYLTDRLTDFAEEFIEKHRERPFLLYLAHYAVHTPLKAKAEVLRKYQAQESSGAQTNAIYAAMIESVDESVGRIIRKVDALNLSDRTVIVFTSDNGGLSVPEWPNTPATSNAPLRAGKGYLYEGGLRVPFMVRWPGSVRAGRVSKVPVHSADLFPTLLALADVPLQQRVDGVSLAPLFKEAGPIGRNALFWHYPHYSNQGGQPSGAIREGDFKLIQFFEDGRLELYNLTEDLGETNNLALTLPEKAEALRGKLQAWRRARNAQMMEPNFEYQPTAAERAAGVVPQMADGRIVLHAREAKVQGRALRYQAEPHKNYLGGWTEPDDWVRWDFDVHEPGWFALEVLHAAAFETGGSEVRFSVGEQSVRMSVQETGEAGTFLSRTVGELRIDGTGRRTLTVRAETKPGPAVMELRSIVLHPITER